MTKISLSSKRWLKRQERDIYCKQAKADGYRARSAYKLEEIQSKKSLFKSGMKVLDLGAAPGGWSQVASKYVGSKGKIVAVDLLAIDSIVNAEIIEGDIEKDETISKIEALMPQNGFDLVISDMAPNFTGVKFVDQSRSIYLSELALELAQKMLKKDGSFIVKLFHGSGFEEYIKLLRNNFEKVSNYKPKSSRSDSREVYALGLKKILI